MSTRRKVKYVHERKYVAEVTVALVDSETSWSPTISLDDAYKLDDVKEALQAGDLNAAAQYDRVYELKPVIGG
ncbi:MAG: hypothetical protein R6V11_04995 [Ectothiorhodospiraceae bacterium]